MHPMLTTAVKAARKAGNIINRGARDIDLLKVDTKGPKDFVSEIDRAAEAAIVQTLLGAYPDHAILAEEGTAKGENDEAEHVWIIDPLDGTTNFLHGFPQYCVSIACAYRGTVTQAVIYDPVRNDLFTASRGRGAFLNGCRIGDLSGEGDYLHGGQVIAANPKVFVQMVQALSPFRPALLRDTAARTRWGRQALGRWLTIGKNADVMALILQRFEARRRPG